MRSIFSSITAILSALLSLLLLSWYFFVMVAGARSLNDVFQIATGLLVFGLLFSLVTHIYQRIKLYKDTEKEYYDLCESLFLLNQKVDIPKENEDIADALRWGERVYKFKEQQNDKKIKS